MKIKISKSQWEKIGRMAGWTKTAIRDMHYMLVSFSHNLFFESKSEALSSNINPSDIWEVTYNSSAINDERLFREMADRYYKGEYGAKNNDQDALYRQYFEACSISASNFGNGEKRDANEVYDLIKQVGQVEDFFSLIRQSQEAYRGERETEERDMGFIDDQQPSHSDIHGPDREDIISSLRSKVNKISKAQWEKTTGWIKKASLSENVVPVSQIVGTVVNMTADQIDEDMHSKGYFLFREHYRWGRNLSYRNKKGDRVYLERNDNGQMVWMTEDQFKSQVRKDWRPVSQADQDWFTANLG